MLENLLKIFGTKSERDLKRLFPYVKLVNDQYQKIQTVSDDELRAKTLELKAEIEEYLKDIDTKISENRKKATEDMSLSVHQKEALFAEVDKLEEERNKKLEEVLDKILPMAFAVIKETAKRLKENGELVVTANESDRKLAATKSNVVISGDKAIWKNKWIAASSEVVWDMLHYDVQIIGGAALHKGNIAEMATGEGKTLVATLPTYLNALAGRGVHIVTVNDYLARRDSEWMAPLYEFHGLTIDCIDRHEPNSEERKKAYQADITYGTNNEFGFDYLRDNMARDTDELVQRKHHYAMIDEVDSVLIDDARTPLIISGPVPKGDEHEYYELKPRVSRLVDAQKKLVNNFLTEAKKKISEGDEKEGGLSLFRAFRGLPKSKPVIKYLSETGIKSILQKTENIYLAENSKLMPEADEPLLFTIDEKQNTVQLTEKGIEFMTHENEDVTLFVLPDIGTMITQIEKDTSIPEEDRIKQKEELLKNFSTTSQRIHSVNQLLKAYSLFEKDVDYILLDGKVKIVDEQTGRVMEGRRYSDGLHQALEAKENVKVEEATQTYATVTLQNYFRMYHKLAGMTGTAETEAGEFWEIYKLDVVVIPTNRPIVRYDVQDKVYKTTREKFNAVADEIVELTKIGRPVLVGTTSVEISELLSRMLKIRNIRHNVLNAKQHQREAEIVAEAGTAATVTIATNMAGRGTDIKLTPESKKAGGLAIVGTERHESRRVDRQLRGRSGRQGDPGSSQFFVSLEDNLMRLFGSERIAKLMDRMGHQDGDVIQHSMITKSIERAQKKVEENNFGIRKHLLEYDDVMNKQRTVIYTKRNHALFGERLALDIDSAFYYVAEMLVVNHKETNDYEGFRLSVIVHFALDTKITEAAFGKSNISELTEELYQEAFENYQKHREEIAKTAHPVFENIRKIQGDRIENVVVPFADGRKALQVLAPMQKTLDSNGVELVNALEKTLMLGFIDDAWKEHLRSMDDLKQSVRTVQYEQKDPLVIYKQEAFGLFSKMNSQVNVEIVTFLSHSNIPVEVQQGNGNQIHEGHEQKTDLSKLNANKEAVDAAGSDYAANENDYFDPSEQQKQQPVVAAPKIGRNDPCPCGSGKKYKNCHGKDA